MELLLHNPPNPWLNPGDVAKALRIARALGSLGAALSALGIAITLYDWLMKQMLDGLTPEFSIPGGPAPGAPGYVPPGFTLLETREPELPPANWGFVTTGVWLNVAFSPPPPQVWTDYFHPPNGTDNPSGFFSQQLAKGRIDLGDPTIRLGYQHWLKDGVGPGSGTRTVWTHPDVLPQQHGYIDVHPSALPSMFPHLMPVLMPLAPVVFPIPYQLLEPYNAAVASGFLDPLTGHETGPDVEVGTLIIDETISDLILDPAVDLVVEAGTSYYVPTSHELAPPPPYVKEIKKFMPSHRLARAAINAFTETHDAVDAIHKALPKECRRSKTWKQGDVWHRKRLDSMLRDIYNCAAHIDINKALANLMANQIEDKIIGKTMKWLNSQTGKLTSLDYQQGVGTTASKALDQLGIEPFAPLSALLDALSARPYDWHNTYAGVTSQHGWRTPPPDLRPKRKGRRK